MASRCKDANADAHSPNSIRRPSPLGCSAAGAAPPGISRAARRRAARRLRRGLRAARSLLPLALWRHPGSNRWRGAAGAGQTAPEPGDQRLEGGGSGQLTSSATASRGRTFRSRPGCSEAPRRCRRFRPGRGCKRSPPILPPDRGGRGGAVRHSPAAQVAAGDPLGEGDEAAVVGEGSQGRGGTVEFDRRAGVAVARGAAGYRRWAPDLGGIAVAGEHFPAGQARHRSAQP